MLPRLLEQAAILAATAVLLGVPGWSLISLLRVRAALPDTLAVPAGAIFGVLVACLATAVQLAARASWQWGLATHCAISVLLLGVAHFAIRRRGHRRAATPFGAGWGWSTTLVLVVAAAFTWIVRGAVRLDTLYHVSVSRKLVELAHPAFGNVNRFVDGGPNPAYALPGWHALLGWVSQLTGTDPIQVWEIVPVLIVVLGALAAAGLARVVVDAPAATPLGAGAWVLLRVLYARREVDGDAIAFGAVPGQLVFELVLPVLLGAAAVAIWTSVERRARRAATAVAVACVIALVVLHANYVLYVGILGAGATAWWFFTGPRTPQLRAAHLRTWGIVAVACVACMAVLLPLLAQLENFGNAPEDARIDYHLAHTFGMTHIRGGHLYEMFTMPGLLALLAAPVVAARWRARAFSIVSGGLLSVGAFALLPPLYALLAASGSLTVGLRINHVVGMLLGPVLVALVLDLADGLRVRAWRRRTLAALALGVVAVLAALGAWLGYTAYLPDWPGYLAWAALVAVLVRAARRRRAAARTTPAQNVLPAAARLAQPAWIVGVAAVLVVALGLPVGFVSMRRAVADAAPITADPRGTGELDCLGGFVADHLARVPAGSVVLSDPRTSFLAMAVAPIYVVGDYKVWNAATKDNRTTERLAQVNRFFDSSARDEDRLEVLDRQHVDYLLVDLRDPRWLDRSARRGAAYDRLATAMRSLDSFSDVQSYDGRSVAALTQAFPGTFGTPTVDPDGRDNAIPPKRVDDPVACNAFALWKVR